MFRKLTLAAAAGAGYVLGAKAGKERYTQIEAKFREIAGMPAVQNATAAVKETASGVADSAKATVSDKGSSSSASPYSSTPSTSTPSTSTSTPDVVVDLGTGASTQPVTASPSGTTSSGLGSATGSGLGSSSSSTSTTTTTPTPSTLGSASKTAPDITRP